METEQTISMNQKNMKRFPNWTYFGIARKRLQLKMLRIQSIVKLVTFTNAIRALKELL